MEQRGQDEQEPQAGFGQEPYAPYTPPPQPKQGWSRKRKAWVISGSVFAFFLAVGAIGNATKKPVASTFTAAGASQSTSPAAISTSPAAAPTTDATTTPAAEPTTRPATAPTTAVPLAPTLSALAANYASLMLSLGFFPGGAPTYTIDADGNAVCGNLQTSTMPQEIAYEESVDENTDTGMVTNKDILEFVTDSVKAFCPQYTSELPK